MKYNHLLYALTLGIITAGCSSIERSRDLANPNVPAKTLAEQVCSNCHGLQGRSISPNFPNLAAQQPDYLKAQLKEFKGHNRLDPAGFEYMWGLSRFLSDQQIKGLADYYAAQRPAQPIPSKDRALVAEGREVFEKGLPAKSIPPCGTCHGPKAEGHDQFPRLADQHADYLVKQLTVFQRTDQRPEGSIMKTVAHELTHKNMEAVAAYLQEFPDK